MITTTNRPIRMFSTTGLCALVMLAVLGGGCNAMRAGAARHKYINDQTEQHVYQKPIATVWPNVRTMLFAEGYKSKTSDTGGNYSLETEAKGAEGSKISYLVQGTKVDDNSCKVEFTQMVSKPTGDSSSRDLEMEWKLLEKVEPEAASKIKVAADAAGEGAKQP